MPQDLINENQLAFPFDTKVVLKSDDYYISSCNKEAFEFINGIGKNLLNQFYDFVLVFGEKGCGKTHLVQLFNEKIEKEFSSKVISITQNNIDDFLQNHNFDNNNCLFASLELSNENIEEEKLFFLLNHFMEIDKNFPHLLLLTSQIDYLNRNFRLADFKTRFNSIPKIEISTPDDEMMKAVLMKLFMDRQMYVKPNVVSFIASHIDRSLSNLPNLVKKIECLSINETISIPFIKSVLEDNSIK
ncbi:MAG: DnaA/Hda family protein [Alphaproteobacteria bacterium]|nr:DnaA/Hda family protein [Alphaproteobacteria bacterium]